MLAGAAGFDDPAADRADDRRALAPVDGGDARALAGPRRRAAAIGTSPPFETWTALPMPRPHYRGAPAIWPDSYATQVLAPLGARLVPLEDRRFSSAPGGVVIVDTVVPEPHAPETSRRS